MGRIGLWDKDLKGVWKKLDEKVGVATQFLTEFLLANDYAALPWKSVIVDLNQYLS